MGAATELGPRFKNEWEPNLIWAPFDHKGRGVTKHSEGFPSTLVEWLRCRTGTEFQSAGDQNECAGPDCSRGRGVRPCVDGARGSGVEGRCNLRLDL